MQQQSKETVLVLANAITAAVGIVGNLAGGTIGNTLAGTPVTKTALTDLVASHIHNRLNFTATIGKD